MHKFFYAVLKTLDDKDWSYGSFDLEEAKRMLKERYPRTGRIAVISAEYDQNGKMSTEPVCVDLMSIDDPLIPLDIDELFFNP